MAAHATAGRAIRRQICASHGIEYGQTYDPGEAGKREAVWIGNCRECEAAIRGEQQAAEELEKQTAEIIAEAERRIAADPEHEKRIQERAAAELAEQVAEMVAQHCAMKRPEWEEYHRDLEWNRVVAQIEAERKLTILAALEAAGG